MRSVDDNTILGDTKIGFELMKKAATGLADEVIKSFKGDIRKRAIVFCGKGNNGGDGFLAAAILINNGFLADCFSLSEEKNLKGEAHIAFKEYCKVGSVNFINTIKDIPKIDDYNVIVDALLGTGVKGAPRGIYSEVIDTINQSVVETISVDTPSGLNSDSGELYTPCIKANKTVNMGFTKVGQLFFPGRVNVGKRVVVDLGYSSQTVEECNENIYLLDKSDIKQFIPKRKFNGSKYDHGLLAVIAGSRGMTGAAALCMNSALRSGCGMVYGFVSEIILDIMSYKVTEPVLKSVAGNKKGAVSLEAFDEISKNLNKMKTLLIGPGISTEKSTQELVYKIIEEVNIPIILDADGLNAFKGKADLLGKRSGDLVITPHEGEFKRLFGNIPDDPIEKIAKCKKVSKEYSCVVVLKGSPTLIAYEDKCYISTVGNDSLATAGTGDVLSGIISSFVAQGANIINASLAGVYIHGAAGRIASEEITSYGVIASDVCESIGKAIRKIID